VADLPAITPADAARAAPFDLALLGFVGVGAGLSAFAGGLYNLSAWGPATLVAAGILLALVAARPHELPGRLALGALAPLAALWVWALLSTRWGESVEGAMTEAGRWLLYVLLFAAFTWLVRSRRAGEVVLAAFTLGVLALAAYTVIGLFSG